MEISERIKRTAKYVANKKFGYQRSVILTGWGTELHFWKAALSAKIRSTQLGHLQVEQAAKRDIDLDDVASMSRKSLRAKIRTTRAHLWETQKNAYTAQIEWLEQNAQDIAKAAGEVDWKKKMKDMATRAQDRVVNRKMTNAIKGSRRGLNSIKVPQCKWLFSSSTTNISFDTQTASSNATQPNLSNLASSLRTQLDSTSIITSNFPLTML